jgi:hypothetical protein
MSNIIDLDENHVYRVGGKVKPGVTSLTGFLDDLSGIPSKILERKSAIGKATHAAIEITNQGDEVDLESVHEAVKPYFNAYLKFRSEHEFEVVMNEQKVYCPRYDFCGTADAVLRMKRRHAAHWEAGQLVNFDWKTVAQMRPTTALQTAGYRIPCADMLNEPRANMGRAALQLKPDGTYAIKSYTKPNDEIVFLNLVNLYYWRASNGLI